MAEHGAVVFGEDIAADMHAVILVDADDGLVVGGVVDLAEREAVADDRGTALIGVGDDVCRVQKFGVVQAVSAPMILFLKTPAGAFRFRC